MYNLKFISFENLLRTAKYFHYWMKLFKISEVDNSPALKKIDNCGLCKTINYCY